MVTHEDIVSFLDRLSADGATYNEVSDGIWNVRPAGALDFGVVVNYSAAGRRPAHQGHGPARERPAARRARASPARAQRRATCSTARTALQKDEVVLTEALELEHLDFEEFLSAYESITLALASHIRELASFREAR